LNGNYGNVFYILFYIAGLFLSSPIVLFTHNDGYFSLIRKWFSFTFNLLIQLIVKLWIYIMHCHSRVLTLTWSCCCFVLAYKSTKRRRNIWLSIPLVISKALNQTSPKKCHRIQFPR